MGTKWNIYAVYLILYTIKLMLFYNPFNKENGCSLEDENNDFSLGQNIYILIE